MVAAQVIATSGDTHLGGEDFDHRVMEYFMKIVKRKHGVDISDDIRARAKLRREVERAKRALSSQHQARRPPAPSTLHGWSHQVGSLRVSSVMLRPKRDVRPIVL
jgi:hypothetical protein